MSEKMRPTAQDLSDTELVRELREIVRTEDASYGKDFIEEAVRRLVRRAQVLQQITDMEDGVVFGAARAVAQHVLWETTWVRSVDSPPYGVAQAVVCPPAGPWRVVDTGAGAPWWMVVMGGDTPPCGSCGHPGRFARTAFGSAVQREALAVRDALNRVCPSTENAPQ